MKNGKNGFSASYLSNILDSHILVLKTIFPLFRFSPKSLTLEKLKPNIPDEYFTLQRHEHQVIEMRHEINMLQRDEAKHIHALKTIQKDLRQVMHNIHL